MVDPTSRSFSREQLPALLALVGENAKRRWPLGTYLLSSDVAWRLPGSRGNLHLWYDANGIAAYAWFDLITPSTFDMRADVAGSDGLTAQVLGWLEQKRKTKPPLEPWLLSLTNMEDWEQALDNDLALKKGPHRVMQIEVCDSDSARVELLLQQGYEPTDHFGYFLVRELDDELPTPRLPQGWEVRRAGPRAIDARVKVHRDSWHRSSYSREQYERLRAIDIYNPELDLVAVTPEGEFASYCIGWTDTELGVGSFEPVGTPNKWRRQGLAQAVQYEGLRRMQRQGMHSAKIGTASFNDRAFGLYTSCGFRLADKLRTYVKALD